MPLHSSAQYCFSLLRHPRSKSDNRLLAKRDGSLFIPLAGTEAVSFGFVNILYFEVRQFRNPATCRIEEF
jgi:hypothetical protein